ncbi:FAD/NAD(P)-binding domain-containing protein [Dichomitus squalens]|nr:FAD/NAD(P)-binding domain-containing protein [Dichomitus squalens]
MSLPSTAEVLIVGAGPTGVTLALALQREGCPGVVVVDGILQGENTSRAITLHAATMEAFELLGLAEQLDNEGTKVKKTIVWSGTNKIETTYFEPLSKYTKYNYINCVPQHVTERLLNQAAKERGISIYRPHKVVGIKPSTDDPKFTDVFFDTGHVLRARAVVGADGSRSKVRQLANVGWADPTGTVNANNKDDALSTMIIADVTATNPPPFPRDAINLILSTNNAVLWLALPGDPYPDKGVPKGETVFRVVCGIPAERGQPPHAPDAAYIQDLLDTWGPNNALPAGSPKTSITRVLWSSRFRTHSAIADSFFAQVPTLGDGTEEVKAEGGPVMLVGDAAHIHPPMGGQGMNLGIRDGVKLAPVLAEFVRVASANPSAPKAELEKPLQDWAEERRPKALTVIGLVKRLQGMLWVPHTTQYALGFIPYNAAWLRDSFLGLATKFEFFRVNGAYQVSGLGNP